MSLLNILNISGSAMIAQSKNMNIIASNLANADSMEYKNGKFYPYIAKRVIFTVDFKPHQQIGGVKVSRIINDSSPIKVIYDPSNPLSDQKGYVLASNVNPITETVNNIEASRNYQANVEVLKTAKTMILKTLTILE